MEFHYSETERERKLRLLERRLSEPIFEELVTDWWSVQEEQLVRDVERDEDVEDVSVT